MRNKDRLSCRADVAVHGDFQQVWFFWAYVNTSIGKRKPVCFLSVVVRGCSDHLATAIWSISCGTL